MLLDYEGATVVITPFRTSRQIQSKATISKSAFDFGSSSTTPETDSTTKLNDDAATKPGPSDHQTNPEHALSSDSIGSSVGNHIDPFALLEIQANVFDTMKNVYILEASVSGLNSKIK